MNKFKFESAKSLSVIAIICILVLFIILVRNAFSYLPETEEKFNNTEVNLIQKEKTVVKSAPIDEKEVDNDDELDSDPIIEEENIDIFSAQQQNEKFKEITELEIIDEKQLDEKNSPEENFDDLLNKVEVLKEENKYLEAIGLLETILLKANDDSTKLKCFDEIAFLQAKLKHYGSALSYAQKAYNLEPISDREVLLARLYYKVGDTNRAQMRMMNVLKREF